MKRYRVESRSGKNHFRADCTEEELEYWKAICKIDSIENQGKCYYREFPVSKNKKIFYAKDNPNMTKEELELIWNYCELSGGIWMRVRYSKRLKELELNNEDFLLIPLKKDSIALELDGSLFDFNKDTNVRINFKNFMINGKPTLKYKIKTIWWIMKMK